MLIRTGFPPPAGICKIKMVSDRPKPVASRWPVRYRRSCAPGQPLAAVRAGDEPVRSDAWAGPTGIVDKDVGAGQLRVQVEVRAEHTGDDQRDDQAEHQEDPAWPEPPAPPRRARESRTTGPRRERSPSRYTAARRGAAACAGRVSRPELAAGAVAAPGVVVPGRPGDAFGRAARRLGRPRTRRRCRALAADAVLAAWVLPRGDADGLVRVRRGALVGGVRAVR